MTEYEHHILLNQYIGNEIQKVAKRLELLKQIAQRKKLIEQIATIRIRQEKEQKEIESEWQILLKKIDEQAPEIRRLNQMEEMKSDKEKLISFSKKLKHIYVETQSSKAKSLVAMIKLKLVLIAKDLDIEINKIPD